MKLKNSLLIIINVFFLQINFCMKLEKPVNDKNKNRKIVFSTIGAVNFGLVGYVLLKKNRSLLIKMLATSGSTIAGGLLGKIIQEKFFFSEQKDNQESIKSKVVDSYPETYNGYQSKILKKEPKIQQKIEDQKKVFNEISEKENLESGNHKSIIAEKEVDLLIKKINSDSYFNNISDEDLYLDFIQYIELEYDILLKKLKNLINEILSKNKNERYNLIENYKNIEFDELKKKITKDQTLKKLISRNKNYLLEKMKNYTNPLYPINDSIVIDQTISSYETISGKQSLEYLIGKKRIIKEFLSKKLTFIRDDDKNDDIISYHYLVDDFLDLKSIVRKEDLKK